MKTISNIRVGKRDVRPSLPSHVPGVREGNHRSISKKEPGIEHEDELTAHAGPRRSTGIHPKHHISIIPGSPQLTPA